MSGVDILAKRLDIISESVNIKVCLYQVMINNGLFEETNK